LGDFGGVGGLDRIWVVLGGASYAIAATLNKSIRATQRSSKTGAGVGSKTYDGVWFIAYADDHLPPHVHGFYAETEVIVDLLPERTVGRSGRSDAVNPKNANRSQVRKILKVASTYAVALHELWEAMNGPAY
jgi:hypothetical protein